MTDPSFPFPAIGTVHLANSHHPAPPDRASARRLDGDRPRRRPAAAPQGPGLRPGHHGATPAARSCGRRPRRTCGVGARRPTSATPGAARRPATIVPPARGIVWRLPGDLGRRYAAVSGDHNPIHLYPLTAKALGFPRQIAHGMWSKARCVAARREPAARRGHRRRRRSRSRSSCPARSPSASARTTDGLAFSLTVPKTAPRTWSAAPTPPDPSRSRRTGASGCPGSRTCAPGDPRPR